MITLISTNDNHFNSYTASNWQTLNQMLIWKIQKERKKWMNIKIRFICDINLNLWSKFC